MVPVEVRAQQCLEYVRASVQVVNGFEQRGYIERHFATAIVELTPLGQQQHRQDVVGAFGHADDKRADRAWPYLRRQNAMAWNTAMVLRACVLRSLVRFRAC